MVAVITIFVEATAEAAIAIASIAVCAVLIVTLLAGGFIDETIAAAR